MKRPSILLIEDTPTLRMVYEAVLRSTGYEVSAAANATDGARKIRREKPDIVVLDVSLPDRNGLELMRETLASRNGTSFIVITVNATINIAVEAMRSGAHEFLVKPFDEQRLLDAIESAARANKRHLEETDTSTKIPGLIGRSPAMRKLIQRIRSAAPSRATVMLSGESGSGKATAARALHMLSDRAEAPFVTLNCGAIPAHLLESELFGHLKGAFPGALTDKHGAVAQAAGGTLFLEDICDTDLSFQSKLLRFVQNAEIRPLGAASATPVDVRLICATDRDPGVEVEAGRFRKDLFYHLQVVPITTPPLRERGPDVLEIAETLLPEIAAEEGRRFVEIAEDARAALRRYSWPGNVRQLMNVLRNCVVLNDGPILTRAMLPSDLLHLRSAPAPIPLPQRQAKSETHVGRTLAEMERHFIEETIAHCNGSIPRAARILDVSPSTIYRKRETWTRDAG